MDGVLVHEEEPIPGAADFVARLTGTGRPFLLLTNNSIFTPRDLKARLHRSGIDVPEDAIWTSALATAQFLDDQRPGGTAYVIGEAGLTTAMHEIGYVMTERDPEYVVLGETRTYSFEAITTAIGSGAVIFVERKVVAFEDRLVVQPGMVAGIHVEEPHFLAVGRDRPAAGVSRAVCVLQKGDEARCRRDSSLRGKSRGWSYLCSLAGTRFRPCA